MYDRTLINTSSPGDEITVVGWVHEVRDLGGLTFLLLRDRSGILQVKFEKKHFLQKHFLYSINYTAKVSFY